MGVFAIVIFGYMMPKLAVNVRDSDVITNSVIIGIIYGIVVWVGMAIEHRK